MADKLRVQRSSALVVDAKSLYDSVRKETPIQGATDKRAAIEQLVLKEQLKETNSTLRWVSSERQLADGLTKVQARTLFAERLKGQQYKLVFDPAFQAAKKKTLSQRKQSEREGIAVQKVEEVLLISNSFLPQTFGLKTTMPPPRQGSRSRHPSAAMDEAPDYDGDEGPPSRSRSRSASEGRQQRSPSKEGKRAKQDDDSDETGRARSESRAPKRQRGERGGQRRGRQVRDRETAQVSSLVIQAPWRQRMLTPRWHMGDSSSSREPWQQMGQAVAMAISTMSQELATERAERREERQERRDDRQLIHRFLDELQET